MTVTGVLAVVQLEGSKTCASHVITLPPGPMHSPSPTEASARNGAPRPGMTDVIVGARGAKASVQLRAASSTRTLSTRGRLTVVLIWCHTFTDCGVQVQPARQVTVLFASRAWLQEVSTPSATGRGCRGGGDDSVVCRAEGFCSDGSSTRAAFAELISYHCDRRLRFSSRR